MIDLRNERYVSAEITKYLLVTKMCVESLGALLISMGKKNVIYFR